jgi:Tol biopolymer transport system component
MSDSPQHPSDPTAPSSADRLESWKEIAAYLRRDVKTVQRWEKREGMPVHRHLHDKLGSVYAFRPELDAWTRNRRLTPSQDGTSAAAEPASAPPIAAGHSPKPRAPRTAVLWPLMTGVVVLAIAAAALYSRRVARDDDPLANARFVRITDFGGIEQAAAISRDGRFVAFLSDRDGQMDVWVTQIGSGVFLNLTKGTAGELINPSVRMLDFSPDGTLVTFWTRRLSAARQSEIGIWAIPVLGGSPRVYLDGVAEYQWSADASRIAYHTPAPGDPMFVRDKAANAPARRIFVAPAGLHGHFLSWSPDGAFVYFAEGAVPDRMDLWRLKVDGGALDRVTEHNGSVTYPVFLSARQLLYLATDRDGSGPWIYSVDLVRRRSRRVNAGIDRFTSLSASSDGRRLVATLATPRSTLWRVPVGNRPALSSDARAITLATGNGSSPRIGNAFLLYVSSAGTGDSVWKLEGGGARQVWTSTDARVVGGPALSRGNEQVAFSSRGPDGRTLLWVVNSDGTNARMLQMPSEPHGAPAWAPDGRSLTIGALVDGIPHLFRVPLDGGAPVPIVRDQSTDPVWSPDGALLVFSGADVGTTFKLKAVDANGRPHAIPDLTLTRGGRRVVFVEGKPSLVFLRGDMQHRDLWALDLSTGAERQLTIFAPGFDIRDFDVTADGRELIVEQVQERSSIVLLERPR